MEPLQPRPWIDPQLDSEQVPSLPVGGESLALTTRAVQRQDGDLPQPLAERLLGDPGFALGRHRVVPAEGEVGIQLRLDRCQAKIHQPGRLRLHEGVVSQVVEDRPPPQGERTRENAAGLGGVTRLAGHPGPLHPVQEPPHIGVPRLYR